jgi:hypothetical protein
MIDDRDVWAAALLLVKRYKEDLKLYIYGYLNRVQSSRWLSPRPDGLRTFPIGYRETPPYKRKEIVYLERLGDRSRRTQSARHPQEVRLECITAPGHGNDGRAHRELTKVSYRLHALFLGHEDIAENKVEGLLPELPYTVFAVHGHGHVIAIRL